MLVFKIVKLTGAKCTKNSPIKGSSTQVKHNFKAQLYIRLLHLHL